MLDGNKRIGHIICGIFLKRNAQNSHASEEKATAAIMVLDNNDFAEKQFA